MEWSAPRHERTGWSLRPESESTHVLGWLCPDSAAWNPAGAAEDLERHARRAFWKLAANEQPKKLPEAPGRSGCLTRPPSVASLQHTNGPGQRGDDYLDYPTCWVGFIGHSILSQFEISGDAVFLRRATSRLSSHPSHSTPMTIRAVKPTTPHAKPVYMAHQSSPTGGATLSPEMRPRVGGELTRGR